MHQPSQVKRFDILLLLAYSTLFWEVNVALDSPIKPSLILNTTHNLQLVDDSFSVIAFCFKNASTGMHIFILEPFSASTVCIFDQVLKSRVPA